MQIGVTNPLRQFLRWKPFPPREGDELFYCWDAHRIEIDGRKMLVICNAANRFTGITAMRAADWKRFDVACVELIRAAMIEAGFSAVAVDTYLAQAGEIEFGRTHGPKAMGCMNNMIELLLWHSAERGTQFQTQLTHFANAVSICHCAEHDGYGLAAEWMAEDLRAHGIEPFDDGGE